jgi:hypothetical protein
LLTKAAQYVREENSNQTQMWTHSRHSRLSSGRDSLHDIVRAEPYRIPQFLRRGGRGTPRGIGDGWSVGISAYSPLTVELSSMPHLQRSGEPNCGRDNRLRHAVPGRRSVLYTDRDSPFRTGWCDARFADWRVPSLLHEGRFRDVRLIFERGDRRGSDDRSRSRRSGVSRMSAVPRCDDGVKLVLHHRSSASRPNSEEQGRCRSLDAHRVFARHMSKVARGVGWAFPGGVARYGPGERGKSAPRTCMWRGSIHWWISRDRVCRVNCGADEGAPLRNRVVSWSGRRRSLKEDGSSQIAVSSSCRGVGWGIRRAEQFLTMRPGVSGTLRERRWGSRALGRTDIAAQWDRDDVCRGRRPRKIPVVAGWRHSRLWSREFRDV